MNVDPDLRKLILKRFNIPLTWLDLKRVQHPVNAQDNQVICESIQSSGTSFTSGWLNDEVLNFYFSFLEEVAKTCGRDDMAFFSSFFYKKLTEGDLETVRRWRRKSVNVAKMTDIIFPVHVYGIHWCLGVIRYQEKKMVFYDPLGGSGVNGVVATTFFDNVRWLNVFVRERM